MLQKLNNLSAMFYIKGKQFIEDFKNDEKGLSGIVTAIMLISVAVLAAGILWGLLEEWIIKMWEDMP